MSSFLRRLAAFLRDTAILLVLGSLAAAFLFRLTPGSGTDFSELTPGMSEETRAARRAERERTLSTTGQSVQWFLAAVQGDFGRSMLTGVAVRDLILERAPATLATVAVASTTGLLTGTVIASIVVLVWPGRASGIFASGAFLGLLSLPAGLLVLLAIFARMPIDFAVAAAVCPRVYFYAVRLLGEQSKSGYFVNAVASGIPALRVLLFQIVPALRSELGALAGLAVVTALSATIPAEALSDRPGIGHLAWHSATQRDLPVLVAVTLCLIVASRAVTLLSSIPPRESRFAA